MILNILGQEYELLELSEEEYPKLKTMGADAIAELYSKRLVINKDANLEQAHTYDNLSGYVDKVVRHEIVHAYFHEAGLMDYCKDEILVDWLALQIPKMVKTMEQATKER